MQLRLESLGVDDRDIAGQLNASHASCEPRVPGEPGIWILIFGDLVAFTVLFCVFLHDQAQARELFASSRDALNPSYAVINTLLLLTGSLAVVAGVKAMRSGMRTRSSILIAAAIGCGLAFSVIKIVEYSEKISAGIVPTTNAFWMYYYVLTGMHLLHLVLGLFVLVFCFLQARRGHLSDLRFRLVEGGACFWHMVDVVWIFLFPLLYLVR